MKWWKFNNTLFHEEAFIKATAEEGWIWVRLMAHCTTCENHGLIAGAGNWSRDRWLVSAQMPPVEKGKNSPLWKWVGNSLRVKFYPLEVEEELVKKRKGGHKGGVAKARNRKARLKAELDVESSGSQVEADGAASGSDLAEPGSSQAEAPRDQIRSDQIRLDKSEIRGNAHTLLEPCIPTLEEVRTWAQGPVGVDPDYAEAKFRDANEKNAWVFNGRVVDWRSRFKRFWETDREGWFSKKKNGAHGRLPTDNPRWWTDPLESLPGWVAGLTFAEPDQARRLEQIRQLREEQRR